MALLQFFHANKIPRNKWKVELKKNGRKYMENLSKVSKLRRKNLRDHKKNLSKKNGKDKN